MGGPEQQGHLVYSRGVVPQEAPHEGKAVQCMMELIQNWAVHPASQSMLIEAAMRSPSLLTSALVGALLVSAAFWIAAFIQIEI